ncbi:MAG TPA: hypothetical protein VK590_04730 [Saprospiraceae bacterium]|nr:hypothetical protein [Saprospiraceae bacterium]
MDFKEYKTCSKCLKEFDKTSENFYKSVNSKDGFYYSCKPCDNAIRTNRFKEKLSHNISRICAHCKKHFYAELCRIKTGRGIYCSILCSNKDRICVGKSLGEKNPNATLNKEIVSNIKSDLSNNVKDDVIRKKYKIRASHLCSIKARRIWRHI